MVIVKSLSASLLQTICMLMNHLCEITLNKKTLHKCEELWKFSSRIKAKLCSISHLQFYLPVCKNMALPVHPQLFSFNLVGSGRVGHLASFSNIFWFNKVCTSHFSLQMAKVQSTNHKLVLICMNLGVTYFLWPHCLCRELSKHHSALVNLECYVVYSAG